MLNRYEQQIKLAEIGPHGQEQFKNLKVLCIGAGGLGSSLLLYLAAAGVGTLGIVDGDTISETNLHRQILYSQDEINRPKVHAAKARLESLNSEISINVYPYRANKENAATLISQYDIVADCSDNFYTRYLIHDICFELNKVYVYASASQFRGHCGVFTGSPCLHCIFPYTNTLGGGCSVEGVLGVSPGLLGIIQAAEILKWSLSIGNSLHKKLLLVDLLTLTFKEIELQVNPECRLCSSPAD